MDSLNEHRCMPVLCAVVRKLGTKIKPDASALPNWMKNLKETLKDPSTHSNIKVFILKLIFNTEDVFRPYAAHWLEQICAVINEKSLGNSANYMITDTLSMILSWHDVAIPNPSQGLQKMEASNLLLSLMNMSLHPRRDIMKFILELVKTMIEVWKPALSINYQLFYEMICKSTDASITYCGLQLTAIVLLNKLLPWNNFSAEEFLECLLVQHLMCPGKKVYLLAAENTGILYLI